MICHQHEQGSPEWLESRRGVITGSRFKDARDRTAKGALSSKAKLYPKPSKKKSPSSHLNTASSTGTSPSPKSLRREASIASSAIRRGNE